MLALARQQGGSPMQREIQRVLDMHSQRLSRRTQPTEQRDLHRGSLSSDDGYGEAARPLPVGQRRDGVGNHRAGDRGGGWERHGAGPQQQQQRPNGALGHTGLGFYGDGGYGSHADTSAGDDAVGEGRGDVAMSAAELEDVAQESLEIDRRRVSAGIGNRTAWDEQEDEEDEEETLEDRAAFGDVAAGQQEAVFLGRVATHAEGRSPCVSVVRADPMLGVDVSLRPFVGQHRRVS